MDVTVAAQVLTMVLAAVAIVWHQQRSIDKLRAEMREEFSQLREELSQLRGEFGQLRAGVASNGQRLARIEGYLGIGMPPEAAALAAGATPTEPAPAQ